MTKNKLHTRNRHNGRYDFNQLKKALPELIPFVAINKFNQEETIDFNNPEAVKMLNRAILKSFYDVDHWDIPPAYLCPPIPGRADYVHYLADLLSMKNHHQISSGEKIKVLDIGTGANVVYPLIGHAEYGWHFVGTDIDLVSIQSAQNNLEKNPKFLNAIDIRHQENPNNIFKNIIQPGEFFDLTMCNPPFHSSMAEARAGTKRKLQNLGIKGKRLNFGGQSLELWCPGGELAFIKKMIQESVQFSKNCLWFTCLVSKKENLSSLYGELKRIEAFEVKTFEMSQGQKISRFIAWNFNTKENK